MRLDITQTADHGRGLGVILCYALGGPLSGFSKKQVGWILAHLFLFPSTFAFEIGILEGVVSPGQDKISPLVPS